MWRCSCLKVHLISSFHGIDQLVQVWEPLIRLKKFSSISTKRERKLSFLEIQTVRVQEVPIANNSNHICSSYELFSFKQLIEESTRVTPNRSSILTHIATTSPSNIFEAGVHKLFISDHYMVFCVRKFEGAMKKYSKIIQPRSMKILIRIHSLLMSLAFVGSKNK